MANRSISVKIRADIADFQGKVALARQQTKDFADDAVRSAAKHRQSWESVGRGMTLAGAAVGAGVAFAIKKFADFDAQMSAVQAATHETAANMDALRDAALKAGADTAFSASEAAQGIEELSKAGVETQDVLKGGLAGALDLAAAGGIGVAEAAETAATAMTQFGLSGSKVPHIADLLAAAAGKAQGGVSDMGMALKQAGLVASQTGLSIEETTAGLAAFASAGLIGSDAGTSFKTMLQRLTPQSAEAADLMSDLGISAYDAQGQFIGLEKFAGNLRESLKDLTPEQRNAAMATIFGSDAVRAASVLYEQGASGVAAWTEKVNDAGYAAETAATRMDNLKGDIEQFLGSVETALIGAGEAGNGPLRSLTQNATEAVNRFSALPSSVQQGTLAVGALASGTLLLGGAFLQALPKIQAGREALENMGRTGQLLSTGFGKLSKAVGFAAAAFAGLEIGVAIIGRLQDELVPTIPGVEGLRKQIRGLDEDARLSDLGDAFSDLGGKLEELTGGGWQGDFDRFMSNLIHDSRGIREAKDAFGALDQQLADLVGSGQMTEATALFSKMRQEALANGGTVEELRSVLPLYGEALAGVSNTQAEAAQGSSRLTSGLADVGGQAQLTAEDIGKMVTSLSEAGLIQLSTRAAARQYEQAIRDASDALKENGRTLDTTTQKGADNEAALDAIAEAAHREAQAIYESTGNTNAYKETLLRSRPQLVEMAKAFGMSEEAANKYADEVLNIPAVKSTEFHTPGLDSAISKTEYLRQSLLRIGDKTVHLTTVYNTVGRRTRSGPFVQEGFADGGTPPVGRPVLVGERGPELVTFAQEARVHSASVTAAAFMDARSGRGGGQPGVVSLSNADIWKLADAVSRVQLSLNGRAIAENTQSRQDFLMRAGG